MGVYKWVTEKVRGKKPEPVVEEVDEPSPTLTLGMPYPTYDNHFEMMRIRERQFIEMERERERRHEEMRRAQEMHYMSLTGINTTPVPQGAGIREQISHVERSIAQSQALSATPFDSQRTHYNDSPRYVIHTGSKGYEYIQQAADEYISTYKKMATLQNYTARSWWEKKLVVLNANTRTI